YPAAIARGSALKVAMIHVGDLGASLGDLAPGCWSGDTQSDFQAGQCAESWRKIGWSALLAVSPFAIALFFLFLAWDSLQFTYRRIQKKIEKGQGAFTGTVTEPAELPNDLYGYLYCMHSISVQLANGHQARVYVPVTAPLPRPGQLIAAIEAPQAFGRKRFIAMAYTPHVAVVSGA
ncbi:MAG: hypothetical protein NDJ90_02650, partial [Oligoflexia bacterium]|nr:hypothetical protein [Oligoflexia bacterium]